MFRYSVLFAAFLLVVSCGGRGAGEGAAVAMSAEHDHDHKDEHNHGQEHVHGALGHEQEHAEQEHAHSEDARIIEFNPRTAAELGFEMTEAALRPLGEVVHVAGQVAAAQGDEAVVSAPVSGMVVLPVRRLADGVYLSKGQTLMTIVSDDMLQDNYMEQFRAAKAAYDKAAGDYSRAVRLAGDTIVSAKELASVTAEYEQAKSRYEVLARNAIEGGKRVVVPISGYVGSVDVRQGQYVASGTPLAVVTQGRRMRLRVDVPQRHFAVMGHSLSARFVTPYDGKCYDIADMDGHLISKGRSTDGGFFVPVTFEFDGGGKVMPGSFVEVYLSDDDAKERLAVPVGALVEEQGVYSVYKNVGPDEFEKQYVRTGINDGEYVEIVAGLKPGDKVVSSGAYYVKLAGVSASVPAHSHSH
ncbi:MAG: efflux RND transporter periplasmic adaptor subunit [Rikenellaceae bacterium]|nr:efflux RND transporter periplasmic adaptor subunit [Rikenellaceae bacterium]